MRPGLMQLTVTPCFAISRDDCRLDTFAGEFESDGASEAAACAGHERSAVAELKVHADPPVSNS